MTLFQPRQVWFRDTVQYNNTDEGPTLEKLDFTMSVSAVHQPFYISICT